MKYNGLYCQLKMTDGLLSYRVNKLFVPLCRLRKFNPQIELPLNIIVDYEFKRYLPGLKGLVLYIQSSSQKHKVRKLRPVNLTYLPKGLVKKIEESLDSLTSQIDSNKRNLEV